MPVSTQLVCTEYNIDYIIKLTVYSYIIPFQSANTVAKRPESIPKLTLQSPIKDTPSLSHK